MPKYSLFKKGPVRPLVLLIILSVISLPFLTYSVPYSIKATYYASGDHVPPGYYSESFIRINMKGGYHDKNIEIKIIECVGDWIIEPEDRKFVIKPDSSQFITLGFTVPEDSQDDDEFFIRYEIIGDYNSGEKEKKIQVIKDLDIISIHPCPRWDSQSGSDFVVRKEIFGFEGLMVVSAITIYIIAKKGKKSTHIPEE
jgi:hypothetical protein